MKHYLRCGKWLTFDKRKGRVVTEQPRMKVKAVEDMLRTAGWRPDYVRGSHQYWKHSSKSGKVPVPRSSKGKDNHLAKGTAKAILRPAGIG